MARPTIWQEDVATDHQGKLKEIVGIGQPAIKEDLPKKCYHYYLRNIIVVVVVNMFIFVGENDSLGPGHTTKLYVHL